MKSPTKCVSFNKAIFRLFLLFCISLSITTISNAQPFKYKIVKNINSSDRGPSVSSVVYKNKLYFSYETLFTSTNRQYYLGEYNGTSIKVFPNPASGPGFIVGKKIVYRDNLYALFKNSLSKFQLAKFDGKEVKLISNPDNGLGIGDQNTFGAVSGKQFEPIIFRDTLFFSYKNEAGRGQLAKFDGDSITLIPNPDDAIIGFRTGTKLVSSQNSIYFIYDDRQLAKYNGTSIVIISRPDSSANLKDVGYAGSPIVYKENLYILYNTCHRVLTNGVWGNTPSFNQLAKYDGTSFSLIPNADTVSTLYGDPFIYQNSLYVGSHLQLSNREIQLAKFNGISVTNIPNPDAGSGIQLNDINPTVYKNKLHFGYYTSTGKYKMATYDTSTNTVNILSTSSLAHNTGKKHYPIVYKDKLFYKTETFKIASYDGVAETLVSNVVANDYVDVDLTEYTGNLYLIKFLNDSTKLAKIEFLVPKVKMDIPKVTTPSSVNLIANGSSEDAPINERGFVYALTAQNSNPTIDGVNTIKKVVSAASNGNFSLDLTGLSALTNYSVRAYAINEFGTSYTSVQQFSTNLFPRLGVFGKALTLFFDFPNKSNLLLRSLSVKISAKIFKPLTKYKIRLFSDPITLAEGTISADGELNLSLDIPQTTPSGDHRIVIDYFDLNGNFVTSEIPLSIDEDGFISQSGNYSLLVVPEKQSDIVNFSLADSTDLTKTVTYSIIGGADSTFFNINSSTGKLVFKNSPIFRTPLDSNRDNTYNVIVHLVDNGTTPKSDEYRMDIQVAQVPSVPSVILPIIKNIGSTGILTSSEVDYDGGGGAITERGFVYSLTSANANPLINGTGVTKVAQSGKMGIFESILSGLALSSDYTYKAYAINTIGTGYSDVSTFTTLSANSAPMISYSSPNIYLKNQAIPTLTPEQLGGTVVPNIYGEVSTFAGSLSATSANSRVDATGNAARFNGPMGMAKDAAGNIYVADRDNHVIRKITSAGVVTTFAGIAGSYGSTDGLGSVAKFNLPDDIVIDPTQAFLYVSDRGSHKIRKIEIGANAGTSTVTTIAGGASYGSADNFIDGLQASFNYPAGMAIDPDGNLFVADYGNNKVRKLSPVVSSINASTNKALNYDGTNDFVTLGNEASFDFTNNMTVEAWVKIPSFTKAYQAIIAKGDKTWSLIRNSSNSSLMFAIYYSPTASIGAKGTKAVNDNKWHHIAGVVKGDSVMLYVDGVLDGTATRAGLAINTSNIAVTIGENLEALGRQFNGTIDEVRIWNKAKSMIELRAGMFNSIPTAAANLVAYYNFDQGTSGGTNTSITTLTNSSTSSNTTTGLGGTFNNFALTGASSNFVAGFTLPSANSWSVSTLAGTGTGGGANNKPNLATFTNPQDVAIDANGDVFVAEALGHRIRKITTDTVTTFAGSGTAASVDGKGVLAQFNQPYGLAFDGAGKLFVAESEGNRIRVIDTAGMVSTFAGTGADGANNGSRLAASFRKPRGLLFDPTGYLYVSDYEYDKIRKVYISGYEINHGLVTGVTMNTSSATISGTPTEYSYKTIYNNDFSNGIGAKESLYGHAKLTGDYITLTPAVNTQLGAFKIDSSGNNASRYNINFKLITTKTAGGDGLSYSFGDDVNPTAILPAAQYVSGTKLSISFASSGTTKGVRVYWASPTTPSLDIIDASLLAYSNNTSWIGKASDVRIMIDENAKLSVLLDGVVVISQVQLPTTYVSAKKSRWQHLFKAVTSITNDVQGIDNVVIEEGFGESKYDITAHNYYGDYKYSLGMTVGDKPILTTKNATNITYSTAVLGGNITGDGGSEVTERGFCWSTNANPTIADGKLIIYFPNSVPGVPPRSHLGEYYSYDYGSVSGLNSATQYYARAYATNAYGTSYGNEITFTTKMAPPEISYTNRSYTIKKGDAITPIALTNTGSPILRNTYGVVRTFAGRSTQVAPGQNDGDVLSDAEFNQPSTLHIDKNGNLFVADMGNDAIRKITPAGVVSTFAQHIGYTIGTTRYSYVSGMTSDDNGNLYVTIGNIVRKITPLGLVSNFVGGGILYDGLGTNSAFNAAQGLVTDALGNMFVADQFAYTIRKITPSGQMTTYAGQKYSSDSRDGFIPGVGVPLAFFNNPSTIQINSNGELLVFDKGNHKLRKITPDGYVSTLPSGLLDDIQKLTTDDLGRIYFVSGSSNINTLDLLPGSGMYAKNLLAGPGMEDPGFADGVAADARFNSPMDVVYNSSKNELYVAEMGNNKIRAIGLSGYSISPELPAGLNFNKDNGEITGTPSSTIAPTSYIITARNGGGIDTTTISLTVNLTGAITTPKVTTNGVNNIMSKSAIASGAIVSDGGTMILKKGFVYSTSPNPTIDNALIKYNYIYTAGYIQDELFSLIPSTTYYVKAFATNSMGTVYGVEKTFTTLPPGIDPPIISYSNNTISGNVGVTITPITPVSTGGAVDEYSISPALPMGLRFNNRTGEISGTPMVALALTNYTIKAYNASGSNSANVSITFTAVKKDPGLSLADITKPNGATPFRLEATSNSNGRILYESSDYSVVGPFQGLFVINGVGTARIRAYQSATDIYNAATTYFTITITEQTPVVTLDLSNMHKKYGDGVFSIGATSTSKGALTYTSSNANVATISGNQVTITGAGETTITASQAADLGYSGGETTAVLNVEKADQQITLSGIPTSVALNTLSSVTLSATSTSALPVDISSGTGSVATLSGNVLGGINGATGLAIIVATQIGNDNYNEATLSQSFDVTKNNQTISFAALSPITYSPSRTITLTATTNASLDVAFSVENGPATVSDNILTVTGAGKIMIKASQDGDASHNAANPVYQELIVDKAVSAISLANISKNFGDPQFDLALTSSSDGVVTYTSSDPSIARISDKTVQIVSTGTVTITASQIASDTYNAATTTATLIIGKANPELTLPSSISKRVELGSFEIAAASNSNSPITYTSSNPSIASIVGNIVTFNGTGSVEIVASQVADDNFNAASSTTTLTIEGYISTSISLNAINKIYGEKPFAVDAISNSTGAISYTSSNLDVATITNNMVTIVGVGETIISAMQETDGLHAPVSINALLTVTRPVINKENATITLADINKIYGAPNFTLVASSNSNGNITYTSSNENIAKINGNAVTIISAGTVSITANQSSTDIYNEATTTAILTIAKQAPAISLSNITKKYGDAVFTIAATSTSTGAFNYTSSNLNVATISGDQVNIVGAGEAIITANQTAVDGYESGQKTAKLTVAKADQAIALLALPTSAPLKDLTNVQLTASATSGLPLVYSLGIGSVATLNSSNQLVGIGATGTVVVNIMQAGNDNYNAANFTQSFDVTKNNQSIIFAALTTVTYSPSSTITLTATSSAALNVSYTIVSGSGSIANNILTITGAGKIVIQASQDGDATHNPANPVYQELIVNKAVPVISLANITKDYGDANFDLSITSSSVGQVLYSISDPAVARISDKTVQVIAAGTVTITASQVADENYQSATASGLLIINKIDPLLTLPDSIFKRLEQGSIEVPVFSKSSMPITYTSSDPLIASIVGNIITFNRIGEVAITATQVGDNNFNDAYAMSILNINGFIKPTISLTIPAKIYGDLPFNIAAVSNATGEISYRSSNENIAKIIGNEVTILSAGEVTITATQLNDGFYSADSTSSMLIIGKATLSVTADDKTKVYGAANPILTQTYIGFKGTDNEASLTTAPSASTTVTTTSGVGTYTVTTAGGVSGNYNFEYTAGKLDITKAPLTITAVDASRCYAATDPTLTVTYAGFKLQDNAASLTTQPTVATNAVNTSVAGDYKTIASGAEAANYDFVYVDGKFTVNPLPTGTVTSSVDYVCDGATLALNITGGANYVWYKNSVVIAGASTATNTINSLGDYKAKLISAAGCEAMSTNTLTIKQYYAPVADFTSQYYCVNKPVYMTNKSTNTTAGPVKYLWEDGAGYTSTATSPTFTYTSTGNKTIKLTVTPDYCPALKQTVSKVVAIEAPTAPVRLATQDAIVREAFTLNTRNIATATSYLWSPSMYLLDARVLAPTAVVEKETNFTLLTTVASSCTTSDSLLVRVFTESDIHLPTVFSPNGDGLNDKLQLNLVLVENLQWFRVYDKYNTLVFETKDKLGTWDGTYNNSGTPLPVDTYFWVVSGTDNNGKAINKTGAIVLTK